MNRLLQVLLFLFVINFTNSYNNAFLTVSKSTTAHIRNKPKWKFLPAKNSVLRQAVMCENSDHCEWYCCEVIKNVFNICCSDPLKSVEWNGVFSKPIPIPTETPDM